MNLPTRYQRSRQIAQPSDLKIRYCGRTGRKPENIYSNPFEIGYHEYGGYSQHWSRHDVVVLHASSLDVIIANLGMTAEEYFAPLLQYDCLSCWCALSDECHVDNILERLAQMNTYIQMPLTLVDGYKVFT
jgi:hypothetical protein